MASLPVTTFTELLPLLRRTFSTFAGPERAQLAQRVAAGGTQLPVPHGTAQEIDERRASLVLPTLQLLLAPVTLNTTLQAEEA
jgi:hypothetical protein